MGLETRQAARPAGFVGMGGKNMSQQPDPAGGGAACVATSSGMAAILSTVLALCKSGDHIVTSRTLFGSTINLFNNYFAKFGVGTTYVDPCQPDEWRAACKASTKRLFVETPTNPLMETADIAALAKIAHEKGTLLAVDNAFLTPGLQRPLALGPDLDRK